MKIIYVNCGVKNHKNEDYRSTGIAEVKGSNPYNPELLSGFLFATAKVAYITAMILIHIILHSAVDIYDFHILHDNFR